ncbi:MAG: 16S rRNA (cytidine(1402)-2'-O)-methyltransferase [Candidatus Neomarinimicrobiota bacterium]|jgi:16S rRNA (cytidine1402-2'-O)-methyltransferase|nr:16S rRNA (cytidine(1402)-2'-O)-methyltransferase [Candidatus Neomarinimicrobiota bacterium]MDX9779810.1 16S rRNA (cytidine(1402)-2'-O)-methyltransferase [bacterium]
MEIKPSTLYIVGTPIGNLEDISYRAVQVLKDADVIVCEDTRVTGILMARYEIPKKPLLPHYKNREADTIGPVLKHLQEGRSIALVSDAGTPGISDPGCFLVSEVVRAGFTVEPIPGPSAATALLSVSHIPNTHFYFEGFLPHKKGRQTRLKFLADMDCGVVFYESTHRIMKFLAEILEYFGDRKILLGRELTKLHETVFRGTVSGAIAFFEEHSQKGEFVIYIHGKIDS